MPDAGPGPVVDPLVTVCDACLCASCWNGLFYCEKYRTAGIVEKRVSELRALGREHPSYFVRDSRGGSE